MAFGRNVFINCPFDGEYWDLLRPILFCIIYLGFEPRIALERSDSGENRIDKILELIRESQYGIHDLSRLQANEAGEFFRLNMPFELGVDYGCKAYAGGAWSEKKILILEAESHRFKAAISDLSGSDIGVHKNEPVAANDEVRNWLAQSLDNSTPGPAAVWGAFNEFMGDNYLSLKERGYSDENIAAQPMGELIGCMRTWVTNRNPKHLQ
ncbi:hypothetical protein [Sphingomonas sp.]|jgi:hypothetical protein|uniref:hypothetical protein n=1 Tax=Sphingomonas sp. TaxID=28214 RepID=UPI002E331364|nr:hypothetical protein [Sphingomonas sp.]HEX4693522.1 hypothetical protein [Sphingomonas sp.]